MIMIKFEISVKIKTEMKPEISAFFLLLQISV
jgi:hypothetical protein